ncbi:hypothetical protein NE237_019519 [Protea cynaroides]|uniref:NET domain-containing protein n=1 Tax=Protea cynaroides TaxID=273540 RepID=A0A9Q0H5K0_9MAGN|nr:hypothetical protein NE237_019519 [Protea cynaroides]
MGEPARIRMPSSMVAYGCRYCAPLKHLVRFNILHRRPLPQLVGTLSVHLNLSPFSPINPRLCTGSFLFLPMEKFWSTRGDLDKNKTLIKHLQQYGVIRSIKVAEVMETIDRGLFVPDGIPGYIDSPTQIGYNATISAPHMHAMCLELLEKNLQPGMHALDVGSGTGYLTACFVMMVGPQGRAVGVEHIPELVATSINNIQKSQAAPLLKGGSLSVHVGDGRLGWPELAPYDAIHVGAAAPEIPQPLLDQLKPGVSELKHPSVMFRLQVEKLNCVVIECGFGESLLNTPLYPKKKHRFSVSSLVMSEASVPHAEQKEVGPNYFGYHKHEIVGLLSQTHELSATCAKVKDEDTRDECGRESKSSAASSSLFCDGIGDGLSDSKRQKLKASLKESVLSLNQEVDEMVDPVMAMYKIKAYLRGKVDLPSSSGASSGDLSQPSCKKQKKSSSPSLIGTELPAEAEDCGEVDDDLRVILENGGLEVEETVKKYSDELFAKLGHMEQQLEELLDIVMSKSRSMTITEKQELRKLIQELPPKNLDRIVEIVRQKRPPDCHPCNEVSIDLEEEDNATLWRLYYYVEAVASAKKKLSS